MEIKTLITKLEDGSLPKSDWNHFTHILLALYYVFTEQSEYEAITKVRCTLIRYGTLKNAEFVCPIKYHETITLFWIYEIKKFVDENKEKNLNQLIVEISNSKLISKDYIFDFYSEEIINSPKARATFVPYH